MIPRLVAGADDSAVLVLPGTSEMLSTNWARHTATIFDRSTSEIRATLPTGKGPDGAIYDSGSGLVYVMNSESRDISVIDVRQPAVSQV